MKRIAILLMLLSGCATTQDAMVANEGHTFATGKPREAVVEAIVATLSEDNVSVNVLNEKYGLVNTGTIPVAATTVVKWRGDPTFGLGTVTWHVDLNFTVSPEGVVKLRYCQRNGNVCNGYKAEAVARYLETAIKAKL